MAPFDQEEPRRGEDEEDGRRGRSGERDEVAQSPGGQAPQQEDRARQRERDEALREERARGRRSGCRGEREPGAARLPPADRRAPGEERRREEEREQPVGQVRAGHEKADRAREQQDARREALAPAPARGQHEQERGAESREAGGQAGRPRRLDRRPGRRPRSPSRAAAAFRNRAGRSAAAPRSPGRRASRGGSRRSASRPARPGRSPAGSTQDDGRQQQEGRVEDPLAPRSVCRCLHGRFRSRTLGGAKIPAALTVEPHSRWALVLGASSGFGEACSLALARAGWNIFGVHLDRKGTQPNADRIVAEIRAAGRRAEFFNVNAADDEKRGRGRGGDPEDLRRRPRRSRASRSCCTRSPSGPSSRSSPSRARTRSPSRRSR